MDWSVVFSVIAGLWIICGIIASTLAFSVEEKGRHYIAGGVVSGLLGPISIGLLIGDIYDYIVLN